MKLKTSKWRLIPALSAASLFLAAMPLSVQADNSDSIRGYLIGGTKWSNSAGDVYIFRSDGHFEFRCGPGDLRGAAFARDYGRFRVRPFRKGDLGQDKYTLELFTTSSLRNKRFRGKSAAYVQRTAYQSLPIRFATSTKYHYASDAIIYGERFSSKGVAGM